MINIIWFGLLFIGIVVGIATGNVEAITKAAIDSANTGVELSIDLIGMMTLWLGYKSEKKFRSGEKRPKPLQTTISASIHS